MGRRAEGWKLRWRGTTDETKVASVRFTFRGRRYDESTGERDPAAAAARAAEIYASVVSGRGRSEAEPARRAASVDLAPLVARWIASISGTTHGENTAGLYELHMRAHLISHFRTLDRVTTGEIGNYQRDRLRHVTRSTVRKERNTLATFMGWCLEQGHIERAVEMPDLPRGAVGTRAVSRPAKAVDLTPEQVEAFLAALPEESTGKLHGSRRFWVRPRFVLAWETGLRPGTIDALSVPEHFTPGVTELRITAAIDKARFERVVDLSPRALAALEQVAPERGVIFGQHDHRVYVRAAALAAGLPAGFYPYALKHSAMTDLIERGTNPGAVAYMVGHKRISTTAGYIHVRRQAGAAVRARGSDTGADSGASPQSSSAAPPVESTADSIKPGVVRRRGLEPLRCYPLAPQGDGNRENWAEPQIGGPPEAAENGPAGESTGALPQNLPGLARAVRSLAGDWDALELALAQLDEAAS